MDYIIIDEMDCGCEEVKTPSIMDWVREVIAQSKEVKLKKEALTLLLKSAKEYQKIKEAEKKFNKFVEDNKLSKEILKEARGLTKEDIESIEEFIGSDTSNSVKLGSAQSQYNYLNSLVAATGTTYGGFSNYGTVASCEPYGN